jgi:hypothetical protein
MEQGDRDRLEAEAWADLADVEREAEEAMAVSGTCCGGTRGRTCGRAPVVCARAIASPMSCTPAASGGS